MTVFSKIYAENEEQLTQLSDLKNFEFYQRSSYKDTAYKFLAKKSLVVKNISILNKLCASH